MLQAEKDREPRNALNEHRRTLLRRVLTVNRTLRRARILLPAHASAKTYGEQMRVLIDAALELSDIWHEIETVLPLYPEERGTVKNHLVEMERYFETLIDEWRHRYQGIVALETPGKRVAVRSALESLRAYSDLVEGLNGGRLKEDYLPNYWAARDLMRRRIWLEMGVAAGATAP